MKDLINDVSTDKKLIPDLMKSEKGNNFRAISESAILDVLDPILKKRGIYYTIKVKKSDLQIREAFGSKGKKLQFIATVEIEVTFWEGLIIIACTEAVGMGIDDNDKAMGKAYTYAVKYALLKLFRLRYGDDADFEASQPLYLEKPKEEISSKDLNKSKGKKSEDKKAKGEVLMSEDQRDYILGMMKQKGIYREVIESEFGYDPKEDTDIPMKVARAMIKRLQETKDLPF